MSSLRQIVDLYPEQINALVILADLEARCRDARRDGRDNDAKLIAHEAVGILETLIRHYYGWVFEDLPWTELPVPAQEQTARSRPSTRSVRARQKIADTLDAGCIVPPDLAPELYLALRALDRGEIHDLLAHVPARQRGDAQEIGRARLAVLRHVHFRVGKGETAKAAREGVGQAINKSAATIRGWEMTELPKLYPNLREILEQAKEAGRVRARFPGEIPLAEADDVVRLMITDIEDLPLSDLQRRLAQLDAEPKVRNPLRNRHKKVLGKAAPG